MVYRGYLRIGGLEVVNNERVRGYSQTADCPSSWVRDRPCESLQDALGDESYTIDNISEAPWFDPSDADLTGRFYGVYGLRYDLISDSTMTAPTVEGIANGGTIGRSRKGMRQARVRATLIANRGDALEYGVSWLNAALTPGACGTHGSRCGTTDMEFLADCPPERGTVAEYSEWNEVRRNYIKNPRMTTLTGWVTTPTPGSAGPDGITLTRAAGAGSDANIVASNVGSEGRQLNVPYFGQVDVHVPAGYPAQLAKVQMSAAADIYESTPIVVNPGETRTLTVYMPPGPASAGFVGMVVYVMTTTPGDTSLSRRAVIRNAIIQKNDSGYFDGTYPSGDLVRYSWAGTPNDSQSIEESRTLTYRPETDDEYLPKVAKLRRFMHDIAVISGPIVVEELASRSSDIRGVTLEWTIASERPWVYSATRPVNLPVTPDIVIQDIPYNLAPYPSAELSSGTVVVATNYSTNPSVETNATGWGGGVVSSSWTSGNITSGRVTGELAAVGTASFRTVLTTPSAGSAASNSSVFYNQQEVDLTARPANSRVSVNVWSASISAVGNPTREPIRVYVFWRATAGGATIGSAVLLGTIPVDGGSLSASSIVPPAGANFALIRIQLPLTLWASGDVVRLYSDALAVTVP